MILLKKKKIDTNTSWTYVNKWYLIVPMAILIILYLVPLVRMLLMSLFEFEGVNQPAGEFTLKYYEKFFASSFYWKVLVKTFLLGLISTLIVVLIGYPVAYKVASTSGTVRHILNSLIVLPMWVSISIRLFGWMNLLASNGFIAKVASIFTGSESGLVGTDAAIVIGLIYCALSQFILIMVGSFENINRELEAAAYVFGAGYFRTFFKIIIPITGKAAMSAAVLAFSLSTAAFVVPVMLGGGQVTVMTNLIYTRATEIYDWGMAAALSVIFMLVAFAITCFGNLLTRTRKEAVPLQEEGFK